jgi:hypothetical protein
MIRWGIIIVLFFLLLDCEAHKVHSVSDKAERQHLVLAVEHACTRIRAYADEAEHCMQAGLKAVDQLASAPEWAWRR